MSVFHSQIDDLCEARERELGRPPGWDDVQLIEDTLLMEWLRDRRFDDLIDHALLEFELQDGAAFCASLGEALALAGDCARFERLFQGLAASREAAFWRFWPSASAGHIGAMKESARYLANALESMAGLYHCYWKVQDDEGKQRIKNDMLRLQLRQRAKKRSRKGDG